MGSVPSEIKEAVLQSMSLEAKKAKKGFNPSPELLATTRSFLEECEKKKADKDKAAEEAAGAPEGQK